MTQLLEAAGLHGCVHLAAQLVRVSKMERTMDAGTFALWRDERLDLATSAALADVDGDGVHLMPVTEEGYAGVARLADTIQALASARSS